MADEVFMTGTAAELTPIREVDDYAVGDGPPGPITRAGPGDLRGRAARAVERYADWRDEVPRPHRLS